MGKLFITAGHEIRNGKGTGAHSAYGDEAILARHFVTDVAKYLWRHYKVMATTDKDNWRLSEVIAWLGRIVTLDCVCIDVHFNTGPATATGVEVFVPKKFTEIEYSLALNLGTVIANTLKLRNRGVKTEDQSQHNRIGILSGAPQIATNILVEICFLTNQKDMESYHANYDMLVKEFARNLYYHL
jgi:N-acetylmuramoyl-L-alanine amidase